MVDEDRATRGARDGRAGIAQDDPDPGGSAEQDRALRQRAPLAVVSRRAIATAIGVSKEAIRRARRPTGVLPDALMV